MLVTNEQLDYFSVGGGGEVGSQMAWWRYTHVCCMYVCWGDKSGDACRLSMHSGLVCFGVAGLKSWTHDQTH